MKIGLITIATGNYYDAYVNNLVHSLRQHFLPDHQRHIFVLTERPDESADYRHLFVPRTQWPMGTLLRFHWMTQHAADFAACDYLFYIDADMIAVNPIDEEVLADGLAAVRHPGFYPDKPGTFDRNPDSLACVPKSYRGYYFQGCFFGGRRQDFLAMADLLRSRIQSDLDRKIIALWHDESHLNWFFAQHPPAKALLPSYAYVLPWNLPVPQKIVHLAKDHAAMRT